jgi:predicted acyltransferase
VRTQIAVLLLILVGYWAAFAFYPAPGPDFNYAAVGAADPATHPYTGLMSHWNKNSNVAWAADLSFMNLFPRERPFEFNGGGYSTLSFIPTLGTMLLGLLMGEWLKSGRSVAHKLRGLAIGGAALVLLALMCQWTGICPIVKRIWTPAWTLYSGGVVVLMIAAFYALMEWKGRQAWAFPLVVVGMNSIAIYVMSWTMRGFALDALRRHVPGGVFLIVGPEFETALRGAAVMLIFWGVLYWMYRKRIFIKI